MKKLLMLIELHYSCCLIPVKETLLADTESTYPTDCQSHCSCDGKWSTKFLISFVVSLLVSWHDKMPGNIFSWSNSSSNTTPTSDPNSTSTLIPPTNCHSSSSKTLVLSSKDPNREPNETPKPKPDLFSVSGSCFSFFSLLFSI